MEELWEVTLIPQMLSFIFFYLLFCFADFSIFLFCFFVEITFVKSTWATSSPMCRPIGETEPAETVATLRTNHVHTAFVFGDWKLALRTWLTRSLDKLQTGVFIRFFIYPVRGTFAWCWCMVLVDTTFETKYLATFTGNFKFCGIYRLLQQIIAFQIWTLMNIFLVICKLFWKPEPIFVEVGFVTTILIDFILQVLYEIWMWHNNITSQLWTSGFYAKLALVLDHSFQMPFPANCAEFMATDKRIGSHVFIVWVKLHIHHITQILVVFLEPLNYFWILFVQSLIIGDAHLDFELLLVTTEIILSDFLFLPVEILQNRNDHIYILDI